MSYASRSLYNDGSNASSLQTGVVLKSILASLKSSDLKILKNIQMSESAIDNTTIGLNIPSTGRFSSLTVGFSNLASNVNFYGPNNSSLAWNGSSLMLQNSAIQLNNTNITSTTDMLIGSNTKIKIQTPTSISVDTPQIMLNNSTLGWNNGAMISPGSQNNSINFSDPIPYLGIVNSTTDSGIQLSSTNQETYFLGHTVSKRFSGLCDSSLQYISNPTISTDVTQNKKVVESANATASTFVEFGHLSAERLYLSFEKIMLSSISSSVIALDSTKYISKIYCLDAVPVSQDGLQVMLPNGDDDGQVKVIQWLPAVISSMTMSVMANSSPQLVIHGNFCLPVYLNS
ncbi:MAG: hypothetical protein EOP45_22500, partial [Sphingobacteriaceae bacterium]